jgi:superfamily I DNA/RNA helicase
LISDCKLGLLLGPTEVDTRWRAGSPEQRTVAALYHLYEARLAERGWRDFDDLVYLAVRLLRTDAGARGRWQGRFTSVLVDEFQDIEPAQELMVRIAAAPQDSLLTVGDEDQTLYAWRRASVERIVAFDQAFPALARVALETNYRCPPRLWRARPS